ncbi:hypothetical protein OG453_44400 [Streptomyces sp. NBC_01381]|uniref:hypothetical protein n=1 Tax=Streptomyces sp. NBC_01381 TaxID=2903845 RepID=UPI002253CE35|nr:hypothetical protein [Streptomyces sp. NBC_01381]MCX4673600.1 hypothetical protein [Streptomyces sp. NBC_01381]
MSTTTEPAADELLHAAALTKADVDALETFLKGRFNAMWRADPDHVAGDLYRAASALADVLHDLVKSVRACFHYDDGSPKLLLARMRHWNRLVRFAERWHDADGYHQARWIYLFHVDAEDVASSAEFALGREREEAARERDRLLQSL